MNEVKKRAINRKHRATKVRAKVSGTADKPRLIVNVTNSNVHAQVINDVEGKTLASSTSQNVKELDSKSLSEKASWVGADVAKKAKAAKIKAVVFDRSHKMYHGRVKAAADAARKEGLEF